MHVRNYVWSPWRTAEEQPGRLAVVSGDDSRTFGELVSLADDLAAGLTAHGVREGELVATSLPAGPTFFALVLACLRHGLGMLPVSADVAETPEGAELLARAQVRLHLTGGRSGPGIPSIPVADLLNPAPARVRRVPSRSRAGYLTFLTSGTTGEPKIARHGRPWYPYRGVAVMEKYAAGLRYGPHVMANPAPHLGTVGPAIYALQAGSTVVIQRHWSAEGLVELIDRHRADSVFLSPDLLLDVVASAGWSTHTPRVVIHTGSACSPNVKRDAIRLMGPVLHEFYGISQGAISEIGTEEWLRHPGSVGRPLAGVDLRIRNGEDDCLPGQPGDVLIRFRKAARGMRSEAFLATGDIGYTEPSGHLHILGRSGIGRSIEQATIEYGIRTIRGVTDVVVLAPDDGEGGHLSCFIEAVPEQLSEVGAHIATMAEQTPGFRLRSHIEPTGHFPRTASGKLHIARLLT